MAGERRVFLTPDSIGVLRRMQGDIEKLKRPARPPKRRRALVGGPGGAGVVLRYCLIREVVDEFTLRIQEVKRTDRRGGINLGDAFDALPSLGVLTSWYEPMVWPGEPTIQTNYPILVEINGFDTVLQTLKFELKPPADPREFPTGGCFFSGG